MMLIPCILIEPAPATAPARQPLQRSAVFDADTGLTYVEAAPDLVTVITGNGVQLSFRSTLSDWCNKLIAAAAEADDEPEETEQ